GRLGIVFRTKPEAILEPNADATHPEWLPGARLHIAESCLRAEPGKTAIVCASEAIPELRRVTYGELHRPAARVANGLSATGTKPGDRVGLYLPMTPESVGIYLGVVLAGCCVVGIADASAPADFAKRSGIARAKLVFTVDAYLRDGKEHPVYGKVTAAEDRRRSSPGWIRRPRPARRGPRSSDGRISSVTKGRSMRCLALPPIRRTSCSRPGRPRIRRRSRGPIRRRSRPPRTPTCTTTWAPPTSSHGRPVSA